MLTANLQILNPHNNEPLVIAGDSRSVGAAVVEEKQDRNSSQEWQLVVP